MERIQKILSSAGVCSRRKAESLLIEGRVTVDGVVAQLGEKADVTQQKICVDGKPIEKTSPDGSYIVLHKPKGYLTSVTDDRGRKTVMDLLGQVGAGLWPVGRLDLDSEGLLLLTNDGALTQRLTHPSYAIEKTYQVTVTGEDIEKAAFALKGELILEGQKLNPAKVSIISREKRGRGILEITINEGKNRQVRRMCALVGLTVTRLVRMRVGNLQLGNLQMGQWRNLTAEEIINLKGS